MLKKYRKMQKTATARIKPDGYLLDTPQTPPTQLLDYKCVMANPTEFCGNSYNFM